MSLNEKKKDRKELKKEKRVAFENSESEKKQWRTAKPQGELKQIINLLTSDPQELETKQKLRIQWYLEFLHSLYISHVKFQQMI